MTRGSFTTWIKVFSLPQRLGDRGAVSFNVYVSKRLFLALEKDIS